MHTTSTARAKVTNHTHTHTPHSFAPLLFLWNDNSNKVVTKNRYQINRYQKSSLSHHIVAHTHTTHQPSPNPPQ